MGLDLSGNGSSETMFYEGDRRSKPGCRIVGLITIVWLTTEADDLSSLHCVIVPTDVMSDHIGRRDASQRGPGAEPMLGGSGRSPPPPRKLTAYYGYFAAKPCTILCI